MKDLGNLTKVISLLGSESIPKEYFECNKKEHQLQVQQKKNVNIYMCEICKLTWRFETNGK